MAKKKKWTEPGLISREVNTCSETAFQRAIFFKRKVHIKGLCDVTWLDMELPVDAERKSGRGHCPDLIGRSDNNDMVLCELKFGKPGNGDPNEAKKQLDDYYESIIKNYRSLDFNNCLHHSNSNGVFLWEDFTKGYPIKIIAANDDYWESWANPRKKQPILPPKDRGLICCSVRISSNIFRDQKGLKDKYEPKIPDGIFWEWEVL